VRKLLIPLAGLLALSLVLGACDAQLTPYAARVGTATIPASTLNASLRAIADDAGYRCEVLGGSSNTNALAIEGTGGSTFAAPFAAEVLTELIQYAAARDEVERLGLAEGAFARQLAVTQLQTAFTPSSSDSGCTATGSQVFAGFSSTYKSLVTQYQLDDDVLSAHLAGLSLTRAGVAAYEKTHRSESSLSCTSVIEVASKATAVTAKDRIAAGASFASVAKSESTDSSGKSGGAIGCLFPSEFTSPLNTDIADLPVGQVSAPVQFESSYLLLLVTSRPLASVSDAAGEIFDAEQAKVSSLLSKTTSGGLVTIDPAYGTWEHSSSGWAVESSAGPANALLPSPAAVTPVAASAIPG
jgi:hypothetical protein